MPPKKIIIDTDPGIDDAMAIVLALSDPRLDLVGMTTVFGNVTTATATRNALRLAELAGRPIPVAHGAEAPLVLAPQPPADFVHGPEGFGDIPAAEPQGRPDPRPAHRFLVEEAAARPGEIWLVAVGPLTNLALALDEDPAVARNLAGVIVMGGAVRAPGNVSARGEANIWNDPHAADRVFAADWPLTLVPLDVTTQVICTAADFAALSEARPGAGGFLNAAVQFYFGFHRRTRGFEGCYMHDPSAVIRLTDPGLFRTEDIPLIVHTQGDDAGRSAEAPDSGRRPVTCCLGVDAEGVRRRFLDTIREGGLP
ncbi:MAG TPA: nucleoside hydrolase [Thermohalobaculum sp.]|nr:nucleoside hydrolase [Thermohalobaculum sp.]